MNAAEPAPPQEFSRRLERVRTAMETAGLDRLLVFSDEYRSANVRYLSDFRPCTLNAYGGLYTPAMILVAPAEAPVLFVPDNQLPLARSVAAIADIRPWKGALEHGLKALAGTSSIRTIGIDGLEIMPVTVYETIAAALPGVTLTRSDAVAGARVVKSAWEIEMLAKTARIHDRALGYAVDALRAGMFEWEIAAVVDAQLRAEGCSLTVPTLIGIGPNAADGGSEVLKPSWETRGNRQLREGDGLIVDIAAAGPEGYCGDLCRGLSFGTAVGRYAEIVEVAVAAMAAAVSAATMGATTADIERASHGWVEQAGYGEFFTHEAFHGIGLEVEEAPFAHETELVENMCISVESGIYLPDSMGVRLEDVVVVTGEGPRLLNHFQRDLSGSESRL